MLGAALEMVKMMSKLPYLGRGRAGVRPPQAGFALGEVLPQVEEVIVVVPEGGPKKNKNEKGPHHRITSNDRHPMSKLAICYEGEKHGAT